MSKKKATKTNTKPNQKGNFNFKILIIKKLEKYKINSQDVNNQLLHPAGVETHQTDQTDQHSI